MSLSDCKELRIGKIHIPLVKVVRGKKSKKETQYIYHLNIINYSIKVEFYNDSGIVEILLLKNDGSEQGELITNVIHLYDPCLIESFCVDKNISYLSLAEKDEDKIISEFNIYTARMINDINFFKSILDSVADRYKSPNTDE